MGMLLDRGRGSRPQRVSVLGDLYGARWAWHALLGTAVILVLLAPMYLSGSTFGGDWPTHLWLVQAQERNIESLGHPSFFVQSSLGAFEPWFAFYGGTLYSLAAAGALVLGGHTLVAYVLSFALAMAMAYGGFTWIAKVAGLKGWVAHVPAFVFLSSAYYIDDIFARGAWPETVATSAIPLLAASALALLRAKAWRPGPVLAFVVSVVLFSGSHNITLLYGTLFLLWLSLTAALALRPTGLPPARRVLALGGLGLLAAGINLWFLLPDLIFQGHTTISHSFTKPPTIGGGTPASLLFNPIRGSTIEHFPTLDVQLPTLALVWAVATLAVCWRGLSAVWRRLAVALAVTVLPFLAVLLLPELWHAVPRILWSIQFPYRLLTYVDFCAVGLLTIALVALVRRRARVSSPAIAALIAIGLVFACAEGGQAIAQEWSGPSSLHSRSEVFPPDGKVPTYWPRFVTYLQYQDTSLPVVDATIPEIPDLTVYNGEGANVIPVPVTPTPRSGYAVTFTPPESGTITTNVISGPYLVAVDGGKFVGRTPYSELVLSVKKNPTGPTRVTFSTARTWPIVVGKWATFLCVLLTGALLLALTARRVRERNRRA